MATNQDQTGALTGLAARAPAFDTHPLYQERLDEWVLMEDCYAGERRVKGRGTVYLPATPAMCADGMKSVDDVGYRDYRAYKLRAIFYDVVREAVQSMVGVMHRKEATITVPDRMKPMVERITPDGESACSLLRKINEQQLINARVGLLVEVPTGQTVDKAMPFVATYAARSLINWDTGVAEQGERRIEMVALDESAWERQGLFKWKFEEKTRVLISGPAQLDATVDPAGRGYWAAVLRDGRVEPSLADFKQPSLGGRTMDEVPFVFVNANDLVPDPEAPPLLGLAHLAIAAYRADADLAQNLFMQGQDTLVLIGSTDDDQEKRVGAGAVLDLPKGGDAKYVGVGHEGLDAQDRRIEKLLQRASERGSKLLDFEAGRGTASSGEALKVRVAARTTTLTSIAITGAEGLEAALRLAAKWMGLDPDEVSVEPNLEFADQAITGQDLVNYVTAKNQGLPMSWESIHALLVQNDLTSLTFEEEQQKIDDEPPPLGAANVPVLNPDGSPVLHPTTGKALTEPAPKRGAPTAPPSDTGTAGSRGSTKPAKGARKPAQANSSGQQNQ